MKNLISVHDVNKGDEKFLLKVHNASVKGQYLNSNKIVKYSDHARWFKLKLKSSNSQIYIGKKK